MLLSLVKSQIADLSAVVPQTTVGELLVELDGLVDVAFTVGLACGVLFAVSAFLVWSSYRRES